MGALAATAASGWLPDGGLAGAVLLLVVLPAASGVGTAAALAVGGRPGAWRTAAVAAVGMPFLAGALLLLAAAIAGPAAPGVQQVVSAGAGGAASGALARRFTPQGHPPP